MGPLNLVNRKPRKPRRFRSEEDVDEQQFWTICLGGSAERPAVAATWHGHVASDVGRDMLLYGSLPIAGLLLIICSSGDMVVLEAHGGTRLVVQRRQLYVCVLGSWNFIRE